jgi:hypothetical protein
MSSIKNIKSLVLVGIAVLGLVAGNIACSDNGGVGDKINQGVGTALEDGCTQNGGTTQDTPLGKICHPAQ